MEDGQPRIGTRFLRRNSRKASRSASRRFTDTARPASHVERRWYPRQESNPHYLHGLTMVHARGSDSAGVLTRRGRRPRAELNIIARSGAEAPNRPGKGRHGSPCHVRSCREAPRRQPPLAGSTHGRRLQTTRHRRVSVGRATKGKLRRGLAKRSSRRGVRAHRARPGTAIHQPCGTYGRRSRCARSRRKERRRIRRRC